MPTAACPRSCTSRCPGKVGRPWPKSRTPPPTTDRRLTTERVPGLPATTLVVRDKPTLGRRRGAIRSARWMHDFHPQRHRHPARPRRPRRTRHQALRRGLDGRLRPRRRDAGDPRAALTAIMGASGSGKSTLLHCMAGLDALTGGRIFIGDRDLAELVRPRRSPVLRRERIGFVFQAFNLHPDADRAREHPAPLHPRGSRGRLRLGRRGGGDRRSHAIGSSTARRSSRAASSSAWRSRERWRRDPTSCSVTSRPATSTRAPAAEVLGLLRRAVDDFGQTVVMVTHDPGAAVARRHGRVPRRRPRRRRDARSDCRARPRPHDRLRELNHVAADPHLVVGSPPPPGEHLRRRRARRRVPHRHPGARRHAQQQLRPALHRRVGGHRRGRPHRARRSSDEPDADPRTRSTPSLLDPRRGGATGSLHAEGQVVGYGSLIGRDGDAIGGNGPPRLAGELDRRSRDSTRTGWSPGVRHGAADEVVVNRGAADAGDLHLGDTTTVQTPDPVPVRIVGIATFGDADGLGSTTWTAFTLASAQDHVTHDPGKVNTILVQAEPGVSSATVRGADRRRRCPATSRRSRARNSPTSGLDSIANEFLDMLRAFLVVFAVIALVVADADDRQHVLDRRRPAHPRAGAPAGGRCVAASGARDR